MFFGAGAATAGNTAAFVKTDVTTAGTWKGVYGPEGANVIGDSAAYPPYLTVTHSGALPYTWVGSTSDTRALQKAGTLTDRIAANWYTSTTLSLDLKFSDTTAHQVALYLLDFDNYNGRTERVEVLDADTNAVLDTHTVSAFTGGQYLVWRLGGHVVLRVTNTNSNSNAVISGLFIGGGGTASITQALNTASFIKSDTTTSGTWQNVYGADGANVMGGFSNYPAYASVMPAGSAPYTWAIQTADPRAPQKASFTQERVASCIYTPDAMVLDVNLSDGKTHQLALYLLDWDSFGGGRTERIEILDAASNTVLDTRSAASFSNGQYLSWNISGHVLVRITNTKADNNAVLSGIFFQ
jgi:hypothetical protein